MVVMRLPCVKSDEVKNRPASAAASAGRPDSRTSTPCSRPSSQQNATVVVERKRLSGESEKTPLQPMIEISEVEDVEEDTEPLPQLELPAAKAISQSNLLVPLPVATQGDTTPSTNGSCAASTLSMAAETSMVSELPPEAALLAQADVSAEQQLAARDTMVTLASAFQVASNGYKRNEALLQRERERAGDLSSQIGRLKKDVKRLDAEVEDAKVSEWRQRLENSGSVFRNLMCWSREAMPVRLLGKESEEAGDDDDEEAMSDDDSSSAASTPRSADTRQQTRSVTLGRRLGFSEGLEAPPPAMVEQAAKPRKASKEKKRKMISWSAESKEVKQVEQTAQALHPDLIQQEQSTETSSSQQSSQKPTQESQSTQKSSSQQSAQKPTQESSHGQHQPEGEADVDSDRGPRASLVLAPKSLMTLKTAVKPGYDGDLMMLRWCVQLWLKEAKRMTAWRLAHIEICTQTTEALSGDDFSGERDKLQAETDKWKAAAAAAESKAAAADQRELAMQDKFRKLQEEFRQQERSLMLSQEGQATLQTRLAEAADAHAADKRRYQDDLEQLRMQVHTLTAERDAQVEEFRKLVQEQEDRLARERAAWETERTQLKAVVAKITAELQDAVSQVKRMAMMAAKKKGPDTSQEDFADLIAELSSMRERLDALTVDYKREKQTSWMLQQSLRQTSRKMELERQFLPLKHSMRGPVGMLSASASTQDMAAATNPQRLTNSASWGGLPAHTTAGASAAQAPNRKAAGGRSLLASTATRILK